MFRKRVLLAAVSAAFVLGCNPGNGNTGPVCGNVTCEVGERCCDHCADSCVDETAEIACPDDTDPGRSCIGTDAGAGTVCANALCDPGEICCIDCDGNGTCGPPGSACPGFACPSPDAGVSDAGVTDSGTGVVCGMTVCSPSESCCIDCDGTGLCVTPGGVCPGAACKMPCAPGTCRVNPGSGCEEPTGPLGNGCCECTGDECTAFCICAAPDTLVATPSGERAIASIVEGDLVYSVDGAAIVAVPVAAVRRSAVREDHVVVRLSLEGGAVIEMSPLHPTARGRLFGDLAAGQLLDGKRILAAERVPYAHSFTYDILPASSTGTYFAAGARVGSTLAPRSAR